MINWTSYFYVSFFASICVYALMLFFMCKFVKGTKISIRNILYLLIYRLFLYKNTWFRAFYNTISLHSWDSANKYVYTLRSSVFWHHKQRFFTSHESILHYYSKCYRYKQFGRIALVYLLCSISMFVLHMSANGTIVPINKRALKLENLKVIEFRLMISHV